jgi:3-methyladenine DNA glycosylase AlkD
MINNFEDFKIEFKKLGDNYKTKDVDKFNKALIKNKVDVSFLKDIILNNQEYHRTYFQVSLGQISNIEDKFKFIENNFDKLQDWWHVDQLSQFVDKQLTFNFAYENAKRYINSDLPFVRRWAYVMFMPSLVKKDESFEKIIELFKDDNEYYVQMAEAWLISYLAIYQPEKTLEYISKCPLNYNIIGKAIQKSCDSFRVKDENKESFRKIRKLYK